ncbi:TadE/TadG family type IV pilus assembly protein [Endozoicomonas sp.]|uniref:TadE/TadG family type IV pilus assembly protein n=1 Tax=Endozoicomonas sp. TaxID=1892382 RepID=UPI00383AED76
MVRFSETASLQNSLAKQQKGIAAVEFAMVLPFLVALLLLTVEFGRIYYNYQRLQLAAFDAARYISVRLPGSGLFDLNNLQNKLNNELTVQTKKVAVFGIADDTHSPILPGLSLDDVDVDFNSLAAVENTNVSTSRQSLCRIRALLENKDIFSSLVKSIDEEKYCHEIDGNLLVQINYTYQPIFSEIPLLGLDLSIPMQARASMRVF